MPDNAYCSNAAVKERILILEADNSYDAALDSAILEASRLVDIFLMPYVTTPLTGNDVTTQIAAITADFGASIFKRRMMPTEMQIRGPMEPTQLNEVNASGWFAIAIRKIEMYIRSKYVLATTIGNTAHNPDIYVTLLEKGVITGKEARAFINNATELVLKRTEDITKTLVTVDNETIIKDVTEHIGKYTKQKKFVFVQGTSSDEEGYEKQ